MGNKLFSLVTLGVNTYHGYETALEFAPIIFQSGFVPTTTPQPIIIRCRDLRH